MIVTTLAVLYLLAGLAHLAVPLIYKENKDKILVGAFGVVYTAFAILLALTSIAWLPIICLIVTLIGGIGGAMSYKKNQELQNVIKVFLTADVIMIILLLVHILM